MSFREVLTRRDAVLFLEDVPVAQLAREHGTPLYAYSRSALIERAERLLAREVAIAAREQRAREVMQ